MITFTPMTTARGNRGLYYYGARYYHPKVSVWLSVDPKASKYPSLSPYVFVANNPVMLIDPNGMEIDWGTNFFGTLRAKVSSMMTERGSAHWRTMKNDQTTLYSFDYSKSAAVGQRSDDSYGFVEGLNETSKTTNQDGMYESKTTIFTGSHKVEEDARQSAGVDNLDNLSDQDKSFYLNGAINNSNRSVYNIDDGSTQKGGGFNFTFGNNPNKPSPLSNETSREFNHRILIHESTHGLMMGGNKFWQNMKINTHPEAVPWHYEKQGIDQMKRKRR